MGGGNSSARPQVASMKLPPYNEAKDDLGAYLSRFQPAFQVFNVQPEH